MSQLSFNKRNGQTLKPTSLTRLPTRTAFINISQYGCELSYVIYNVLLDMKEQKTKRRLHWADRVGYFCLDFDLLSNFREQQLQAVKLRRQGTVWSAHNTANNTHQPSATSHINSWSIVRREKWGQGAELNSRTIKERLVGVRRDKTPHIFP